ncbi:uncharacterized protein DSM5745_00237 [Aspergillus mulundensis]|uniref:F-box domain-containing protein n=1 Tax=Aspergillus mulundensis TaxID=1810919 RepID=A0A3D8T2X3_9EURO|nr:hypothetical protein DSM5745_00237 [Aspergillus mulundensis]RDW92915.1 hypothetical protein DSM5745_00237 [Aspergillus mulundensis]
MAATKSLAVNLDHPEAAAQLHSLDAGVQLDISCTENSQSLSLLPQLVNSSSVSSIHVDATYRTADACRRLTQPLKQVLLSCPNLRRLSLDISPPRAGCMVPDIPSEYCGLGFANGERPPALESLEIIAYPWGREPNNSPINFHALGYPEKGEELDYWATTFEWSRLGRLTLHDASSGLAFQVAPKLTTLEELTLSQFHDADQLRSLFLTIPSSLSTVTLPTLGPSIDIDITILLPHAATLRKLEIHSPEHPHHPRFTEQALLHLRDSFPQLTHLTIDIDRAGKEWPSAIFSVLASFPSLQELDLWFPLGCSDDPFQPYLTALSASHLARPLLDRSTTLQCIHLHSGCPAQLGHGFPTQDAPWARENATSFICARAGTEASLTCPDLDDEANNELRKAMQDKVTSAPAASLSRLLGQRVAFQVAVEGPLEVEEWRALHRGDE